MQEQPNNNIKQHALLSRISTNKKIHSQMNLNYLQNVVFKSKKPSIEEKQFAILQT